MSRFGASAELCLWMVFQIKVGQQLQRMSLQMACFFLGKEVWDSKKAISFKLLKLFRRQERWNRSGHDEEVDDDHATSTKGHAT